MKYPYDIVSYVRKKTFSIEARFSRNKEEGSDRPLQVHNSTFSRFVFTAIANGKAATCNVPIELLEDMEARTRYANEKQLDYENKPVSSASEGTSSPAYTVRFFAGTLKGKTPAEILAENGEKGKEILNTQYKWLLDNLEKFPKNRQVMDAIIDSKNIDLSKLKNTENGNGNTAPIVILNIGCRPLIRKKREDGKCFCYEAKVTWDVARKYPVSVCVSNYYAPVIKKEDGTLNVTISAKDRSTEVVNEFNMLGHEWLNAVKEMKRSEQAFYNMNIADAFKMAEKAEWDNRENAKKQSA